MGLSEKRLRKILLKFTRIADVSDLLPLAKAVWRASAKEATAKELLRSARDAAEAREMSTRIAVHATRKAERARWAAEIARLRGILLRVAKSSAAGRRIYIQACEAEEKAHAKSCAQPRRSAPRATELRQSPIAQAMRRIGERIERGGQG